MKDMKKGQIIIDYIIIVALVLILALFVLILFDFLPDFARGVQVKHSADFWKGQARPFCIEEAFLDKSNGRIYLVFKSHSDRTLAIRAIFFNNTQLSIFDYNASREGGVGTQLCDSAACKFSECACDISMPPYSNKTFVTEYYMNETLFCGRKLGYGFSGVTIIYSDAAGKFSNLTQSGGYPLPVECKNSFNN
ncbi:MAG: hypothetical protein ABIH83_05615 [Candidatus Micrarchaeota archaeon]